MRTDQFDYFLPPEQIAQTPLPRGESRLLTLHRKTGKIEHQTFREFPSHLRSGDTLVLNDTRVSARRLRAVRENGEDAEILLLKQYGEKCWEALVKPGKAFKPGKQAVIPIPGGEIRGTVLSVTPEGGRILEFESEEIRDSLQFLGEPPLPPYIQTPLPADEEERYQTVYGAYSGSAAAPTAGLHFTPEILKSIAEDGINLAKVTLHVGVGTFRPVRAETLDAHEMHFESASLKPEAAAMINGSKGKIFAVGTTSVRTLETAAKFAQAGDRVAPFEGETNLFITPGFQYRVADGLLTNFHLPKSTLLMLVSAFAGHELTMHAYDVAVREKYRFFSFGDAMLIV